MFNKPLQFILILLPLLILLVTSAYFGYKSWESYKIHSKLKIQLTNTKLLQSLEHSILNEVVCVATMGQHKNLMAKVCDPTKSTTDVVMHQILQQKDDSSLYDLERVVLNTRNSIEDSGTIVVEKLVNGDLDKELNTFVKKYTNHIKEYSNGMEKKEYIRYFADISHISYATESEKAFVSYYLSLKKPVSEKNLIYWDKTVSGSMIPEFSNSKISTLHNDIYNIIKDENFQTTLRGIDDIRLDFMSHASIGNYDANVALWVSLLNQKQKVLSNIENMLLGHISENVSKELKQHKMITIWALVAFLLTLLGLLLFLKNWGKGGSHKNELNNLLNKIASLSSEYKSIEVGNNPNSYKMAYENIGTSYEMLYEKANTYELENRTNNIFLNNLTYDVQTPLNVISGYTKLLKETSLDMDQNEYISVIQNSYEDLDSLLDKMSSENNILTNKKLEIENNSFDLVKKMESAVETFSVKADQKDILLSAYVDPLLSYNVKGDSIKLSKIMSNMIDNAIKSSKAYDSINITIEQVHKNKNQISVRFSIKDQSVGYNEDELSRIIEALDQIESVESLGNINVDIKNLSISSKIIKRMGGKLELVSKKGDGVEYYFSLSFEYEDMESDVGLYPTFNGMEVGLALPSKDIKRHVDKILEKYVRQLGAELIIYDYETLFVKSNEKELPSLMFVYHHYARLEGELDAFFKLPTKIALLTSASLRSRIDIGRYNFSSIVFTPIVMSKVVKIFLESKVVKPAISTIPLENESQNNSFENIHALVVEDNEISQKLTTGILNKLGIRTSVAYNGSEAFDLRRENDFSIIFMDIEMPIMDGLEATTKILYYEGINQFPHVPIIAVSPDIDENAKEKYLKGGMDDYISKPIEAEVIFALIQKYCIDLPKEIAQSEEDELIAKVLSGDFLKD